METEQKEAPAKLVHKEYLSQLHEGRGLSKKDMVISLFWALVLLPICYYALGILMCMF